MSAKSRSRLADYLVYIAVRITVCIVQALSFDAACGFARFLAWVAYHLDKRHRQVARENLERVQAATSQPRCSSPRRPLAISCCWSGAHDCTRLSARSRRWLSASPPPWH